MKVSTDDDRFGLIVTSLNRPRMFRFQIVIDNQLIGDAEPCILGSAMHQLGNLKHLDDDRLRRLPEDRGAVSVALRTDELLHDAATLSLAESLDRWLIHGYIYKEHVALLAQECEKDELVGPVLVSIVNVAEYNSIFDAVHRYWSQAC